MALPSVHINEVPEQGLTLSCSVDPEELALSPDEGRFQGPLSLDVSVHPVDQGLTAFGTLQGEVVRECVRCLLEYQESMHVPFSAEYRMAEQLKGGRRPPAKAVSSNPRAERDDDVSDVEEGDINHYTMTGDRLDLAEMLREQVILMSPMQPLCREDCLGLCPTCGQDRNVRRCGCQEPRDASPFEMLRGFKEMGNSRSTRTTESPRKSHKTERD